MKKVKQIVKQTRSKPRSSEERVVVLASKSGTPGATRTHDTRFRKPLLYPLSYRGLNHMPIIAEDGESEQRYTKIRVFPALKPWGDRRLLPGSLVSVIHAAEIVLLTNAA